MAGSISTQTQEPELVAGSRSHILKPNSEGLEPETDATAGPATVTVEHDAAPALAVSSTVIEMPALVTNSAPHAADDEPFHPNTTIAFGNLRRCETCGFPVSEGRRLCLDCEAAIPDAGAIADTQDMFCELSDSNTSWVRSHVYLIATALVAVATIALLVWRL